MKTDPYDFLSSLPPDLRTLTQYNFVRELGAGGMSQVYLVENRLLGNRKEALKVLKSGQSLHNKAALRFEQEIAVASKLIHPNIVVAYTAHQLPTLLAYCMEYVEGENLEQYVARFQQVDIGFACYLMTQAAAGLHYAHQSNTIHRDIKPANLMLGRSSDGPILKIVDFGLAKAILENAEPGLTATGAVMGTPYYMAPEQFKSTSIADHRADIYSLGCTFYYVLTARHPFEGNLYDLFQQHQNSSPERITRLRGDCPPMLEDMLERMIAKRPEDRYQSIQEIFMPLGEILRSVASDSYRQSLPSSSPAPQLASYTSQQGGQRHPPSPAHRNAHSAEATYLPSPVSYPPHFAPSDYSRPLGTAHYAPAPRGSENRTPVSQAPVRQSSAEEDTHPSSLSSELTNPELKSPLARRLVRWGDEDKSKRWSMSAAFPYLALFVIGATARILDASPVFLVVPLFASLLMFISKGGLTLRACWRYQCYLLVVWLTYFWGFGVVSFVMLKSAVSPMLVADDNEVGFEKLLWAYGVTAPVLGILHLVVIGYFRDKRRS